MPEPLFSNHDFLNLTTGVIETYILVYINPDILKSMNDIPLILFYINSLIYYKVSPMILFGLKVGSLQLLLFSKLP